MPVAGCTVSAAAALPAAVLADKPNRQRQQHKNHDDHNYTCHTNRLHLILYHETLRQTSVYFARGGAYYP